MSMTLSEQILARQSGTESVSAGDVVVANVDKAMSHDSTAMVIQQFEQIGVKHVWDSSKIIVALDHRVPANTIESAAAHKIIREFVESEDLKNFYDVGSGISHDLMIEQHHALPGELIVGTDSHTTTYGALGAASTGIGATEMAAVWAKGQIWLKVPETIYIKYNGSRPSMIYGKDIILHTIGQLGVEFANYKALEFSGELIPELKVEDRISICNMSVEMGAKFSIIPPDAVTADFLNSSLPDLQDKLQLDSDRNNSESVNAETKEFELSELEPQIACPDNVDNVKAVGEVEGVRVHQALLGTCTNSTLADLETAAEIVKGRKISRNVRMYVVPGTRKIYLDALRSGLIEIFMDAGCTILNPGCGPCVGMHQGLLAPGEVAISSSNRNFKGRMGSPEAKIYLASPATVAATAVEGVITDPRKVN